MYINFADSWVKSWTFWLQFIENFFNKYKVHRHVTVHLQLMMKDYHSNNDSSFQCQRQQHWYWICSFLEQPNNNRSFIFLRTWFSLKVVSFKFTSMSSKSTELSINVAFQFEAVSSDFSEPFKQWMSVPTGHHPFLPAEFHVEVVVCSRHRTHTANLPAHLKEESPKNGDYIEVFIDV